MTNCEIPPSLIRTLRTAQSITVLTGAGVSAESGVPTFRDAQTGLWARFHPEDLATLQAFRENPRLVWEWYAWRRELVERAEPNAGHYALARMETNIEKFVLVTQNVDGLHQRAGSRDIIELHGNIARTRCSQEGSIIEEWQTKENGPPRCPRCGSYLRPDVVWFGESLDPTMLGEAMNAADDCDVLFSIGTSGLVEPAASLPYRALSRAKTVVEINPGQTPLSSTATYYLQGTSGEVIPELVKAVWEA